MARTGEAAGALSMSNGRMATTERVETVVVGAGQAGLATSYHLTRAGHPHVVLERGRVGESWLSQRWDGFRLNTTRAMNVPPGGHIGPRDPHGFAGWEEQAATLDRYAF